MTVTLILIIVALAWYIYSQKSKTTHINPNEITFKITVESSSPSYHDQQEADPTDKDAWEEWDAGHYGAGMKERMLDGVRLNIIFVDRDGRVTQRDVTSLRYAHNPETHAGVLYAFCQLRQAKRPFAFQRIRQATDLETGEIIADVGAFLDKVYQQTPLYSLEQFLEQHGAAAFVLFSFAKADGAMRAKERAIILNWAQLQGLATPEAQAELEGQMRGWYMTNHSFWDAVKSVNKEPRPPEYINSLWSAVVAMITSDKKMSEQEIKFLSYAAKQWGIPQTEIPTLPAASK